MDYLMEQRVYQEKLIECAELEKEGRRKGTWKEKSDWVLKLERDEDRRVFGEPLVDSSDEDEDEDDDDDDEEDDEEDEEEAAEEKRAGATSLDKGDKIRGPGIASGGRDAEEGSERVDDYDGDDDDDYGEDEYESDEEDADVPQGE